MLLVYIIKCCTIIKSETQWGIRLYFTFIKHQTEGGSEGKGEKKNLENKRDNDGNVKRERVSIE